MSSDFRGRMTPLLIGLLSSPVRPANRLLSSWQESTTQRLCTQVRQRKIVAILSDVNQFGAIRSDLPQQGQRPLRTGEPEVDDRRLARCPSHFTAFRVGRIDRGSENELAKLHW